MDLNYIQSMLRKHKFRASFIMAQNRIKSYRKAKWDTFRKFYPGFFAVPTFCMAKGTICPRYRCLTHVHTSEKKFMMVGWFVHASFHYGDINGMSENSDWEEVFHLPVSQEGKQNRPHGEVDPADTAATWQANKQGCTAGWWRTRRNHCFAGLWTTTRD